MLFKIFCGRDKHDERRRKYKLSYAECVEIYKKLEFEPEFFEFLKYKKLDCKEKRQEIVNTLMSNYYFVTLPSDEIYIYTNGIYTLDAERIIKQATVFSMGIDYSREDYLNVLDRIKAVTFKDNSFFDAPKDGKAVQNGILNINNMMLDEFSPKYPYHFIGKLPIAFRDNSDWEQGYQCMHGGDAYGDDFEDPYFHIPYVKSNPETGKVNIRYPTEPPSCKMLL